LTPASAVAAPEVVRPVRFIAVGLGGLAVDTAVFQATLLWGMEPAYGRLVSLAVATLVTWTLNRRFTFDPTGRGRRAEFARYITVTLGAQGFSYSVFLALITGTAFDPRLALWTGAVLAAGASYAGQRLFTFARAPRGETA
jgi:putative flippase GtrA